PEARTLGKKEGKKEEHRSFVRKYRYQMTFLEVGTMSTPIHDSQTQPLVQEVDQSVCSLEGGSSHQIASGSGRASTRAQGLEQKTRIEQCERSAASAFSLRLLPVLLP